MSEQTEQEMEINEQQIELLVDTLRQSFEAEKARYFINDNTLLIEIEGLDEWSEEEITEVAEPVLEELDAGFDEVLLLEK